MRPRTARAQYVAALSRVNASRTYWAGRTSLTHDEASKDPATNEDRTLVEVFEFAYCGAGSNGYLAYWRNAERPSEAHAIVTWTGAILAVITNVGSSSIGSAVRYEALGIDGGAYEGTHDSNDGDLVQLVPKRLV